MVAIAGDGGFMYNVQELATAAQHGIDVVAVVFNDGAYGNVRRMQRELYGNRRDRERPHQPRLRPPGRKLRPVPPQRATDPDELRDALERALARDEPALIEVPVGEMPGPWPYIMLPRVRG